MGESWQARISTLLVVDDDPKVVALLVAAIDRKPPTVAVGACSIAEARERLCTLQPDACIVDMQLPDGCGLELVRELRSRFARARILLFTGYGSMDVGAQAIRAGADDVLAKPASVSEVMDRLCGIPAAREVADLETPTADHALWEHMQRVLHDCRGNKSLAARKLGVDRGTLQRWVDREAPRR